MITDPEKLKTMHIDEKVLLTRDVLIKAFKEYKPEEMAIAITGGKDSTLSLWIFRKVCAELGVKLPRCMFIDEGDVFDEIREFVARIEKEWGLDIAFLKNDDVCGKAGAIGDMIKVDTLNDANKAALAEMDYREPEFEFMPDSTVCNHLLKTMPMKQFIEKNGIKAMATAIRSDEQTARKDETHFSPRDNPTHMRVHPILHFRERDVWIAAFKYDVPFNTLYKQGYRSLGARCATGRASDIPAWMQDLEGTPERAARGQAKEQVMDQLRALGYM